MACYCGWAPIGTWCNHQSLTPVSRASLQLPSRTSAKLPAQIVNVKVSMHAYSVQNTSAHDSLCNEAALCRVRCCMAPGGKLYLCTRKPSQSNLDCLSGKPNHRSLLGFSSSCNQNRYCTRVTFTNLEKDSNLDQYGFNNSCTPKQAVQ